MDSVVGLGHSQAWLAPPQDPALTQPGVDVAQPGVEVAPPGVDDARPGMDVAQP
jgi:hypothetical protein